MGDGSLTQEEIDLLLQGADDVSPGGAPATMGNSAGMGGTPSLSPTQQDEVKDLIFNALQQSTQQLEMTLGIVGRLDNPFVETLAQEELGRSLSGSNVLFSSRVSGALNGVLGLFMPIDMAGSIASFGMGGEPTSGLTTLDNAQIATVKEPVETMLGAVISQISNKIGSAPLTPGPAEVVVLEQGAPIPMQDSDVYLRIQMHFTVDGISDTRISVALPLPMAQSLFEMTRSLPQAGMAAQGGGGPEIPMGPQAGQSGIQDVNFPSFSVGGPTAMQTNMNLLMDVQMTLTVELGRTKMYIKEILGLGEGSIIELDKLAGEPVDLLVNGKLIAKGEVVVIDENFGVRVTDIVSPIDRLKGQSGG